MDATGQATTSERTFQLGWKDLWLVAGFLVATLVADRVLDASRYDVVLPKEHEQNQIHLYAHRMRPEPVDVLIVGSSRVEAGVHPTLVQSIVSSADRPITVARLPVMGLHALALRQMARELLVPGPPRELLVIGIEERMFFRQSGEVDDQLGIRLMGTGRDLVEAPIALLRPHDRRAFFTAPFRGLRAVWQADFLWDPAVPPYLEHVWATGGLPEHSLRTFTLRDRALARGLAAATERRATKEGEDPLLPAEVWAFERAIELLETLPCRIAFVRMPVARAHEEEHARQIAAFEERVLAPLLARGFAYYDLNEVPLLRLDPLLANPSHTNAQGRIAASKALALELVAPLLHGDALSAGLAAAREDLRSTGGGSIRPGAGALTPEADEALEAGLRAELRRRAEGGRASGRP